MSKFITDFGYTITQQVQARIEAFNDLGYGPISSNATTTTQVKSAPTEKVTISLSTLTSTSISITYNSLLISLQTGNSPVTDYEIVYKDITDPLNIGADTTVSAGVLTTKTISGLSANKTYQF